MAASVFSMKESPLIHISDGGYRISTGVIIGRDDLTLDRRYPRGAFSVGVS